MNFKNVFLEISQPELILILIKKKLQFRIAIRSKYNASWWDKQTYVLIIEHLRYRSTTIIDRQTDKFELYSRYSVFIKKREGVKKDMINNIKSRNCYIDN